MSDQDLDTRIRTLVAQAVADAPSAPDLDDAVLRPHSPRPHHRRWWVGGCAAALAAAAALVTAVVLVDDTDDRISTPVDTAPATVTFPAPIVPAPTVPANTIPAPGTTPAPTTPNAPPVTEGIRQRVVTAGPDGVVSRDLAGGERFVALDQPARRGLPVGDGRVLVELGPPDAATGPLMWNPDGTTYDPLAAYLLPGPVTIHDVAIIDGAPVLLYDVDPTDTPEPDATLYAAPITSTGIDVASSTEIAFVRAPEYDVVGLTLASNGLVVGNAFTDGVSELWVRGVPGTRGEQIADTLSWDLGQGACPDCLSGFTVDPQGERLAWVDGTDVVIAGLDGVEIRRIPLGDATADFPDLDLFGDSLAVSYGPFGTRPPLLVNPDGSTLTLEGYTTDIGPASGGDATPRAEVPVVETPGSVSRIVTAGPDGVTELDAGTVLRRLEQPAEVALMTPGGSVIFQAARPAPDGQPGDPLIWRADGTVERLLGELPAGQSYRLYDVADVTGAPTVLYGLSTRPAEADPATFDPADYTEVVYALAMAPGNWTTTQLHELNTWEGGYSHLSLSGDGLVLGETSGTVNHGLFSVVIPGSPAEATGPLTAATLGVRDGYGDEPSPGDFAVSSDGELIAWVEADAIVVHTVASGEQRRWTSPGLELLRVRGIDIRAVAGGELIALINTGWPGDQSAAVEYVLLDEDVVDGESLGVAFASSAP